jgi:hypothetical protein
MSNTRTLRVSSDDNDKFREILIRMVTAIERLADAAQILVERLESDVSGDSETEEKS